MMVDLEKIIVYGSGHYKENIAQWNKWGWATANDGLQEVLPPEKSVEFIGNIEKYFPDDYKGRIHRSIQSRDDHAIIIMLIEFKDKNKVYESLQKYFSSLKQNTR